jgi:hypothetical protein
MLLVPSSKPKKLKKAERVAQGIPFKYHERVANWYTDASNAQRVQLRHLQNGDRFRFLNEYGKPYGPRWTVVFDMEDYENQYGYKSAWGGKYMPMHSMLFRKDGDDKDYHIHHKNELIVKPVNGAAMAVLAKLNSYSGFNYFQA